MVEAVGTFVRAKVDSNDSRQRKSYHLLRVLGTKLHTDLILCADHFLSLLLFSYFIFLNVALCIS